MPKTYEPIQTTTLSAGTASITFNSIPQTYTDLILVTTPIMDSSENSIALRFNSDTGTNYSSIALYASGTSALSLRQSNDSKIYIGRADNGVSPNIFQIFNYSNTTINKTVIGKGSSDSIFMLNACLWRSTVAITSITVIDYATRNFAANSTFTLYGVKAA